MVNFCARITCTELAREGGLFCERHVLRRGVTAKQQRVLDFVRTFTAHNPYGPTVREIGEALNIASTNTVAHYLNMLEEYGLIERTPGVIRGLKVREVGNVRDAEAVV